MTEQRPAGPISRDVAHVDPVPPARETSTAPARAGVVLISLILVAAVANLNLAVANVALPDIGKAFDAGQTALNLVAVGYSLGLAASVLYLGALGDRYGRKRMLLLGTGLAIPACLLAAFAPSIEVLFAARLFGGLAAGMAYPTTLALITALWSGPERTRSIALWSALGGAISALGPLLVGCAAHGVRVGVGVRGDAAARGGGAVSGVPLRAGTCERGDRSGRQPRRTALGSAGGGARAGDQLRTGAERGCGGPRARRDRVGGGGGVRDPPAPGASSRSTTSRWPGGGSSGSPRARG